ncbi:MAG: pitrilysin family protein [Bryobacteraceae bacterium]
MKSAIGLALVCASMTAQVRLPAHTKKVLPNGLTVTLAPRRELPMLTLRAVVRGGVEADPAGMAGLNHMTAELLRRGTTGEGAMGATEFAEALDFLGAEFKVKVDAQSTQVVLDFLAKDSGRAISLLAAALARPAFDEAEVKKALTQQIGLAQAAKDDPRQLLRLYARPFYFGAAHPYGRPEMGDETSLKALTREAIVGLHKRLYVGRNIHLVAAGDFEPAALLKQIESTFGGLPSGERFTGSARRVVNHGEARLLLVDKPDATQTYFTIEFPGIDRTDPDRTVLSLLNTLFGGRFTSMLNDELRVNSGLTYGANSRVQMDRLPGAIVISTFTKTETTAAAVDLAVDVMRRFFERGIDAEQLRSAKAYVKGTFPPAALETTEQVSNLIGELELFGLGRGEVDDLFSRIDAVTLERANAAIKKYFRPERLQFCLVGKAAEIEKDVAKYAAKRRTVAASAEGVAVPAFE